MSGRIAKAPVDIPKGVDIKIDASGDVHAKGKMGEMSFKLHPKIKVKQVTLSPFVNTSFKHIYISIL